MDTRLRAIQVTAAVLTEGRQVLIARRGPGTHLAGLWEFPGGKIAGNETAAQCLERELWEELRLETQTGEFLCYSTHDYGDKLVTLHVFRSALRGGALQLSAHSEIAWVTADALGQFAIAPADLKVVRFLQTQRTIDHAKTAADWAALDQQLAQCAARPSVAHDRGGSGTADAEGFLLRDPQRQVIGGAMLNRRDDQSAVLGALWVDPACRGAGSGAVLLDRCLQLARSRGYRLLTTTVGPSSAAFGALCRNAGFTDCPDAPTRTDGRWLRCTL